MHTYPAPHLTPAVYACVLAFASLRFTSLRPLLPGLSGLSGLSSSGRARVFGAWQAKIAATNRLELSRPPRLPRRPITLGLLPQWLVGPTVDPRVLPTKQVMVDNSSCRIRLAIWRRELCDWPAPVVDSFCSAPSSGAKRSFPPLFFFLLLTLVLLPLCLSPAFPSSLSCTALHHMHIMHQHE